MAFGSAAKADRQSFYSSGSTSAVNENVRQVPALVDAARLASIWPALSALPPSHSRSLSFAPAEVALRKRIQSVLPPSLAVTKVWLPPSLAHKLVYYVNVRWQRAPRLGIVTSRVTVKTADDAIDAWIRFEVKPLVTTLVAKNPLRANQRIQAGDLTLARRPVSAHRRWVMAPDVLVGSVVLRDVDAGAVVDGTVVAEPAPLASGTRVTFLVRQGQVTVSTEGQLEGSARIGHPARVRLTYGRRQVKGVLLNATTVVAGDPR